MGKMTASDLTIFTSSLIYSPAPLNPANMIFERSSRSVWRRLLPLRRTERIISTNYLYFFDNSEGL